MQVRAAAASDAGLLVLLLAMAADWRPGTPVRGAAAVLADPALAPYVAGWPGAGERGAVATVDGTVAGAAWWRFLPGGYGFVRSGVPEVSVAVLPEQQGRGVGTAVLRALVAAGVEDDLSGLSLSVERDNPAARLYQRVGFVEVGGDGGAATMLLRLGC